VAASRLTGSFEVTVCKSRNSERPNLDVRAAGESLAVAVGRNDVASSAEEIHQPAVVVGE
jgi:hypothetical protein